MDPVRLALDVGPLHGHRTGVGAAVAELAAALERRPRRRPAPVRAQLPQPAGRRRTAGYRCPPRSPTGCGRTPTIPASTAGSGRPGSSTARTTWCRRPRAGAGVGVRLLVPRPPGATAPDVRRAGEVLRRRSRAGRPSTPSARRPRPRSRELLSPARVEVVHLGPLPTVAPAAPPAPTPALGGRPYVLAVGTVEPRKNLVRLVEAFGRLGRRDRDLHLVLAGPPGTDRLRSTPPSPGSRPAAGACRPPGWVDDRHAAWLLRRAARARLPVARRGLRPAAARGVRRRGADRGGARRIAARGGRRRRRCWSTRSMWTHWRGRWPTSSTMPCSASGWSRGRATGWPTSPGRPRRRRMAELYRDAARGRPSRRSAR